MPQGEQRQRAANVAARGFGVAAVAKAVRRVIDTNETAGRTVSGDAVVEVERLVNRDDGIFGAVKEQKRRRYIGDWLK